MLEIALLGLAVSVYDGDTVRLPNVPQSFRVVGLDTPEIRGKCPYEKPWPDRRETACGNLLPIRPLN